MSFSKMINEMKFGSMNKVYLMVSLAGSLIVQVFEKYLFNDWQFLGFLLVLVSIDTITGFVKHFKSKTISSRGFSGILSKVLIYSAVLIMTHVIMSFQIDGEVNGFFGWFDDLMYSAIVVREAISILENIAIISPKTFPAWILKRLKAFDEGGNLNELKGGGE